MICQELKHFDLAGVRPTALEMALMLLVEEQGVHYRTICSPGIPPRKYYHIAPDKNKPFKASDERKGAA